MSRINRPHSEVLTHILGEHIGETNKGYPTSIRTPLPSQGVYIRVCPKCGDTKTVPRASLQLRWVCSGYGIVS